MLRAGKPKRKDARRDLRFERSSIGWNRKAPHLTTSMTLPIKLLSTDFDGTIFAEFENPPIPLELQELIGDLQARGVKWVINTGREMASLMESLGRAGISIEPDYLILVEREIHLHQDS